MKVGQYILVRKIGEGGMAEVWEGRHLHLDTRTAVKFLLPEFARNRELQERFLNEGKRQAQLQHPNIVPALDFFQVEGRSHLVMRYVDGESLESRLEKHRPPLTLEEIHTISWDVASALDYAHSLGVIHRDVKPANMLMDRNGSTLLMDFGIAKALREERSVTMTGSTMGTPDYMSPEQIVDPKRVDARSDVYSFGCVLYTMFTGTPPFSFEGATAFRVQSGHVHSAPPPLVYCNRDVPSCVGAVVLKCLEKDPRNRYQTCGAVMAALDQCISGAAVVSSHSSQLASKGRRATIVESKTFEDVKVEKGGSPSSATTVSEKRGATAFVATQDMRQELPAMSPSAARFPLIKYLLTGLVFVTLTAASAYLFFHAKSSAQEQPSRLQRLQKRDWLQARYDDADFADCIGYAPCVERANHAAALLNTRSWPQADKVLLTDCMGYAPCLDARTSATPVQSPALASIPSAPVAARGSVPASKRSLEDLPSCCSKDIHPRECLAIKQREDIRDCASPIGNN